MPEVLVGLLDEVLEEALGELREAEELLELGNDRLVCDRLEDVSVVDELVTLDACDRLDALKDELS